MTRTTSKRQHITVIRSLDEIPAFASEEEEAAFWDTHELSIELWRSLPPTPEALLPPVRTATGNHAQQARSRRV